MKCPRCGNEFEENDRFCKYCGKNLNFVKQSVKNVCSEQENTDETGKYGKPAAETAAPAQDALLKGKVYKYSLRAVFVIFTVFAFVFFALPVDGRFGMNVYRCAAAGNYGDGLDGRWDTFVFVAELFANMFSDIDLVLTPCAFMLFMAVFGACLVIAWFIVLLAKQKRVVFLAEIGLLIFYALFALVDVIMICGLKYVYNSYVGAAPVALLVITLICFTGSLVLYIMRKKYFKAHGELIHTLQVTYL